MNVFLIATFLWSALGFQAVPSCCRLSVTPASSNPGESNVTVTNLGAAPITAFRMRPEDDIRIEIVDSDGRTPDLTAYGKQIRDDRGGSRVMFKLEQNESFSQSLDLRKQYELHTGYYRVAVYRDVLMGGQWIVLQTRIRIGVP